MKVEAECAPCVLHRGYLEIINATSDPSIQFRAMSALTKYLVKEFKPDANPAQVGTERDRIVKRITGCPDPYVKKKQLSNQGAMEIIPMVREMVLGESTLNSRFRKACLCAIVGNVIEFDIPNHKFKFEDLNRLIQQAEEDLTIDEIPKFLEAAKKAKKILYLTDNAGEIVFDTLLVHELKELGANVTVAVKGEPVLNDATMEDAKYVRMHEIADSVITTGTDTVGLAPEECSSEFLTFYNSADLVVAKGMGYAESLTELDLKGPHMLLLRTKCNPVANFFKVNRDKNIAKMMP